MNAKLDDDVAYLNPIAAPLVPTAAAPLTAADSAILGRIDNETAAQYAAANAIDLMSMLMSMLDQADEAMAGFKSVADQVRFRIWMETDQFSNGLATSAIY